MSALYVSFWNFQCLWRGRWDESITHQPSCDDDDDDDDNADDDGGDDGDDEDTQTVH